MLLVLVFDRIHSFQPIHAEPLVLTSLGASAADASELFTVRTILERFVQFNTVAVHIVFMIFNPVVDFGPIEYVHGFSHNKN